MKINITKAEYKALIELLYMGDWMVNAFTVNSEDEPKEYTQITQKIYSYAKQMGCEDEIEYAKEYDTYFPTQKLESQSAIFEHINNYDNDSFWHCLADKLAERDVCDKHQIESIFDLSNDDRFEALCDSEYIWEAEFAQHGLNRLKVVEK